MRMTALNILSRTIVDYCQRNIINIKAIYLFGSQVTGLARKDSDIDIAILCSAPLSAEVCWDLSQDLAILLNCDVDLLDLQQASTVMQAQIIYTGKKIFTANESDNAFFETYVFSDYIRLNEQRKEILLDIKKRGNIYGK